MQSNSTERVTGSKDPFAPVSRAVPGLHPAPGIGKDEQFLTMLHGFRRSGGLARSHDVASLLASRTGLNVGALARWVVQGEVVCFEWQNETWFPLFQFGALDMTPREGVRRVLTELRGVLDPWEAAQWFAQPSAALGGRAPADAMERDPELVFHAARCHRYVVDA